MMSAEIIAITMNKGGVGKTSLISNLVGAISKREKARSLLIDLDGQGNLGISFGLVPENIENTIYDVLIGTKTIKEVTIPIKKNLDIVPANSDMSFIEFDILPNLHKFEKPFELLSNSIKEIADDYDYIFIDTPPAMGLIVGNALVASDQVIIPYVPEVYAVNGLIRIHNVITDFKNSYNPNLTISGIAGMMVDLRTTLHQDMLQQAKAHCAENDIVMFDTIIPRSIRFATSALYGKPATWLNKDNHLVAAYFELLEELKEKGVLNG